MLNFLRSRVKTFFPDNFLELYKKSHFCIILCGWLTRLIAVRFLFSFQEDIFEVYVYLIFSKKRLMISLIFFKREEYNVGKYEHVIFVNYMASREHSFRDKLVLFVKLFHFFKKLFAG